MLVATVGLGASDSGYRIFVLLVSALFRWFYIWIRSMDSLYRFGV